MGSLVNIKGFVAVSCGGGDGCGGGYGYGGGDGCGYGDGYGDGCGGGYGYGGGDGCGGGYGYGDGCGSGYGYGDGCGSGYGDGDLKQLNGMVTVMIDGILTAITNIRGAVAKGFVVGDDLSLTPCYVVKNGNLFAHGKTLREATEALREKMFEGMSEEERISEFWKEHDNKISYPAQNLYEWHNKLTGSCEMGRQAFCRDHGIDIKKDSFTVSEFIELCENSYGSNVINKLRRNK